MLILPALLWREIEDRTRRALPDETCGLLLGRRRGAEVLVSALAAARNIAPDPRKHFELDPLDTLAAEDGARALGCSVVGAWHSHPRGPLQISAHDQAGADSTWLTLIAVPKAHGGIELGCWRKGHAGFERLEVGEPQSLHN